MDWCSMQQHWSIKLFLTKLFYCAAWINSMSSLKYLLWKLTWTTNINHFKAYLLGYYWPIVILKSLKRTWPWIISKPLCSSLILSVETKGTLWNKENKLFMNFDAQQNYWSLAGSFLLRLSSLSALSYLPNQHCNSLSSIILVMANRHLRLGGEATYRLGSY